MDSKTRAPASVQPSRPEATPLRRGRLYILINFLLVFALITYFLYPWFTDRESQPVQKATHLYSCHPNEPIKRVAIIGISSSPTNLHLLSKTNMSVIERRRLSRYFSRLLPLQIHSTLPSNKYNHLRALFLHRGPIYDCQRLRLLLGARRVGC